MKWLAADGGLREQLKHTAIPVEPPPARAAAKETRQGTSARAERRAPSRPDLEFFNGHGGFADAGRQYVVIAHPQRRQLPPAPWVNVVANPSFGFAASESGTGYTWSGNSHDNRLTPWSNDPVRDTAGEAVFIRDDESGDVWSATPLPAGGGAAYVVRHGQGESSYEHTRDGIASSLLVFVPAAETGEGVQARAAERFRRDRGAVR